MNNIKRFLLASLLLCTSSFSFAVLSGDAGTGGADTGTTTIDATQPTIVIDPVTKKIYVTTGYFQNTGENNE